MQVAGLFAAYVLTARFGLGLDAVSGFATLVWPPTGIALFALLIFGYRLWPGVFLGAWVANLMSGAPLLAATGIACGNTAGALLAVFLLRRVGFARDLGRVRDVTALLVVALGTPLVSATSGVASLWSTGVIAGAAVLPTWRAWWLGDALGVLTFAPLLLVAWRRPTLPTRARAVEAVAMFACLIGLVSLVFGVGVPREIEFHVGWPYFIFPGLLWAALRFTQRGAVTATFGVAVVSITATVLGHGPFTSPTLSHGLIMLQIFMGLSSVTTLMLAAAVSERDRARSTAEVGLKASRFLGHASETLASTLDYAATLQAVARLVVPVLGDTCVVDVVGADRTIRRVAEAASDPKKEALLERLRAFPSRWEQQSPLTQVLTTGKTRFIPHFDNAALESITAGDEYSSIVRSIAPRSSVTVPLHVRGEVLGAISFAMAESGRRYTPADIALAEELAERAGAAIDRARDITELKAVDQALRESLRVREDFLAVASHELKTPLAALLLHLQGLERARRAGKALPNLDERLAKAIGAATRLENLIHQLLDVSRITSGRLELEPERFDLDRLLAEVVERFAEQAERAGCALSVVTKAHPSVLADRRRIDQVLGSLLSNAIKYGAGKPIAIEVREENGESVVCVTDLGIGIEQSQQQRIFERFERAASSNHFGGFGLGLWISRQIAEASGGRIEVESTPGQGSAFTLRLPLG